MSLLILLAVLGVYLDHAMSKAAARREKQQIRQDLWRTRHLPRTQVIREHQARFPADPAPRKEGRP